MLSQPEMGGVGTQTVPAGLQVVSSGHAPQLMVPPHPSFAGPQIRPVGHVVAGTQVQAVPWALQVVPSGHGGQLTVPPQPSGAVPQI
jgi:hypothetical protein